MTAPEIVVNMLKEQLEQMKITARLLLVKYAETGEQKGCVRDLQYFLAQAGTALDEAAEIFH